MSCPTIQASSPLQLMLSTVQHWRQKPGICSGRFPRNSAIQVKWRWTQYSRISSLKKWINEIERQRERESRGNNVPLLWTGTTLAIRQVFGPCSIVKLRWRKVSGTFQVLNFENTGWRYCPVIEKLAVCNVEGHALISPKRCHRWCQNYGSLRIDKMAIEDDAGM